MERNDTTITSLDGLKHFASKWVKITKNSTLFLLKGPVGVGKTQFVKYFVESDLGLSALSPSFSLINEYSGDHRTIYHVDLYRLESQDEIEAIGFWELFNDKDSVIFLEWPDRIKTMSFPRPWVVFQFDLSFDSNDQRKIKVTVPKSLCGAK